MGNKYGVLLGTWHSLLWRAAPKFQTRDDVAPDALAAEMVGGADCTNYYRLAGCVKTINTRGSIGPQCPLTGVQTVCDRHCKDLNNRITLWRH